MAVDLDSVGDGRQGVFEAGFGADRDVVSFAAFQRQSGLCLASMGLSLKHLINF